MDGNEIIRNAMEVMIEEAMRKQDATQARLKTSPVLRAAVGYFDEWLKEDRVDGVNAMVMYCGILVGYLMKEGFPCDLIMSGIHAYAHDFSDTDDE